MIRTSHEHHQSYMRLIALAKKAPVYRRERLLKIARLNLKLAQFQLDDPTRRPDVRLRMSADQYGAIAECLSAEPGMARRAGRFWSMAQTAELHDWPSSAIAPGLVLTIEEWDLLAHAPYPIRQRVTARLLPG